MRRNMIENKKGWISALVLLMMVGIAAITFGFKGQEYEVGTKKMANPQWFTYKLDPTSSSFDTDKLNPNNYEPTSITNPSTGSAPCSGTYDFCSIYAETVSDKPDLSIGQPIRDELDVYVNQAGQSSILRQQPNP